MNAQRGVTKSPRRRAALLTTAVAVVVAALGLLARPLLPSAPHHQRASGLRTARLVAPTTLIDLAERTAAVGVACVDASRASQRSCGRLRVTDAQATRIDERHVTIRLVGELEAAAQTTPIAMRVDLSAIGSGWTATVVAP